MAQISDIEGIGPVIAENMQAAGIRTTDDLLARAATAQGRTVMGEALGLDAARLLRFVNHADLMRVKGIGSEYSELLEAAGVDTVPELARRKADNLQAKLAEINNTRKLVRQMASASQVESWIEQAKALDPIVTH